MNARYLWLVVFTLAMVVFAGNVVIVRLADMECPRPQGYTETGKRCQCSLQMVSKGKFGAREASCSLLYQAWKPEDNKITRIGACDLLDMNPLDSDPRASWSVKCDPNAYTIIRCDAWETYVTKETGTRLRPTGTVDTLHCGSLFNVFLQEGGLSNCGSHCDDIFSNPKLEGGPASRHAWAKTEGENPARSSLLTPHALVQAIDGDVAVEDGLLFVNRGQAVLRSFCTGESINLSAPAAIPIPTSPPTDLTDPASFLRSFNCGVRDLTGVWQGVYARRLPNGSEKTIALTLSITGANQGTVEVPEGKFEIAEMSGTPAGFHIRAELQTSEDRLQIYVDGAATKGNMTLTVQESASPVTADFGGNGDGLAMRIYIADAALPLAAVGTPYEHRLLTYAPGAGPITFRLAQGSLPAGITLGSDSGALSGTPTASGDFAITVEAADQAGNVFQQPFNLRVKKFARLNTLLPTAIAGRPYTATLRMGGGTPPYRWLNLLPPPPGLTFNADTGEISGTPDGKAELPFVVRVSDSSGNSFLDYVTIPVRGLTIASPEVLPEATRNAPYRFRFEVVGNSQPVTWRMQDIDPPLEQLGLAFDSSTGELTGIPTSTGSMVFDVTVEEGAKNQTRSFVLSVDRSEPATPRSEQATVRPARCTTCAAKR